MKTQEFLQRLHTHTKSIFENEIDQVNENGRIMNWFLGLAGVALLFSFNKYSEINSDALTFVIIQAIVFVLIIVLGFLHRYFTKEFKSRTTSMIRMFDFLLIEFELVPDDIINDLSNERFDSVFETYINGGYFQEKDEEIFAGISIKQIRAYRITLAISIISIILMMIEFGMFFLIILR